MQTLTRSAWLLLAGVHIPPAMAAPFPGLMAQLYGVAPAGDVALMLSHRAMLFLAIVLACLWGAFAPAARRPLSLIVAISILGFLWLYLSAGAPEGALRTIAIADGIALAPLVVVLIQAWTERTG